MSGSYPGGNGLSEADLGVSANRNDFIASSSKPYRSGFANSSLIPIVKNY